MKYHPRFAKYKVIYSLTSYGLAIYVGFLIERSSPKDDLRLLFIGAMAVLTFTISLALQEFQNEHEVSVKVEQKLEPRLKAANILAWGGLLKLIAKLVAPGGKETRAYVYRLDSYLSVATNLATVGEFSSEERSLEFKVNEGLVGKMLFNPIEILRFPREDFVMSTEKFIEAWGYTASQMAHLKRDRSAIAIPVKSSKNHTDQLIGILVIDTQSSLADAEFDSDYVKEGATLAASLIAAFF